MRRRYHLSRADLVTSLAADARRSHTLFVLSSRRSYDRIGGYKFEAPQPKHYDKATSPKAKSPSRHTQEVPVRMLCATHNSQFSIPNSALPEGGRDCRVALRAPLGDGRGFQFSILLRSCQSAARVFLQQFIKEYPVDLKKTVGQVCQSLIKAGLSKTLHVLRHQGDPVE